MNILMVLCQRFPPDIRVEKEARALHKNGHTLYLLATNEGRDKKYADNTFFKIFRYHPNLEYLQQKKKQILFIDDQVVREISKIITKVKVDAIHVHDLPMVRSVLKVAQKYNIPIIADLHENMPAAMQIYEHGDSWIDTVSHYLFDNYLRWRLYEKEVLKKVDHIIVVVPEAAERIIKYGIDKSKIHIVSNTEETGYFNNFVLDESIINAYKEYFVVSYIGGVDKHRGADTAIKAISYLKYRIPNIKLLLVGGKGPYAMKMKKLINDLKLNQQVEIISWQPFNKVSTYNYISDICLVPHNLYEHTDTTVPHKLFQYMLMKKPVIVSSCRPLKRIVNDTQSGLVFKANDEKDLARKIYRLYTCSELRSILGHNGYNAAKNEYNWSNDAKRLINIYNKLEKANDRAQGVRS